MSFINDIFNSVQKLVGGVLGEVFDNLGVDGGSKIIDGDFRGGDVNVKSLYLLNEDQTRQHDLLPYVTSIDIHESILSPVIYAEVTLQDNVGLMQEFPIIGEEYIRITFSTPAATTDASYMLRVNKVKNKNINTNNKMVSYTLQCVSPELIVNAARYVNWVVNDNISNVVQQLVSTNAGLETSKSLKVDPTSGIESVVLTRKQPFVAIDFLRQRAVSDEYQSSSWVFFENRNGYHFTTVEKLISDGMKNAGNDLISDKQFYFDTTRNQSYSAETMRNILAYNQITFGDTISRVQHGGLTNIVNQYDMITGGVTKVNYTNNIGADAFKKADESAANVNTSTFNRIHGSTTAATCFIPVSSDRPETDRAERISKSLAYAETITQNIVQIHIYGDSDITVGDMINCTFPAATSIDNDKNVSRLDSGNYLVSKLRHIILLGDRPQHTISLELIKGNLTEAA